MIGILALLLFTLVALAIKLSYPLIYPAIRFFKKQISLSREKKKIRFQTHLLRVRRGILLANGYKEVTGKRYGTYFIKEGGEHIFEDDLRGWSSRNFNKKIYGKYEKK